LKENDRRHGNKIDKSDVLHILERDDGSAVLRLPENFTSNNWKYKTIPPIEIIDGQHRLWAFDTSDVKGDFELPVVAFVGLDISWQAYLFYIINIKPKKINASLAFDLYPLLRAEDWLNKFEGHIIYRETRAQELVDILYSHQESPWYKCINMLGEPGYKGKMVSQSAWVKSLLASYIKSWDGRGIRAGGLFGAPVGSHKEVLPWSRAEQAAFLIVVGQHIRDEINECNELWAKMLRQPARLNLFGKKDDLAFYGPNTLLNQDQGIRAILHVSNDLIYFNSDKLNLASWGGRSDFEGSDEERVKSAITSLNKEKNIIEFIKKLSKSLSSYDWRASGTTGLTEEESLSKAAFRGSGGYKELRKHLLRHLSKHGSVEIVAASNKALKALGY
jgi:DGQHR domain-containing protein